MVGTEGDSPEINRCALIVRLLMVGRPVVCFLLLTPRGWVDMLKPGGRDIFFV